MKIESLIPSFLASYSQESRMVRNYVSRNTLRAYENNLNSFVGFLSVSGKETSINSITDQSLTQFLNGLVEESKSPSTRNQIISSLRSFHKWARKKYKIKTNPFVDIKSAYNQQKEAKYISDEDRQYILSAVDKKGGIDQIIFRLLFRAGLRASELIALNNSSIQFKTTGFTVQVLSGKGNKSREIPFNTVNEDGTENKENLKLYNILKCHISINKKKYPEEALLVSNFKSRLTYQGLNAKFKRWMKKLRLTDKGYTLHSCRHTCVRQLQKIGIGIHIIQAICGHSDPIVTQRIYGSHVTLDDIAKQNRF